MKIKKVNQLNEAAREPRRLQKVCDNCKTRFASKYCPECGKSYDDITIEVPTTITTYAHSDKETGFGYCEKYGVDPDSKLGETLIYLNYEIKLIYEIVGNKVILKQVDAGDGQGLCDVVSTKK
jgi:hypothetical protein